MTTDSVTFEELDRQKSIPAPTTADDMPLPVWYRSVYRVPIDQLETRDLCKALRQAVHLEAIVPLVIDKLKADPLAGDMFDCELLAALSRVAPTFW